MKKLFLALFVFMFSTSSYAGKDGGNTKGSGSGKGNKSSEMSIQNTK